MYLSAIVLVPEGFDSHPDAHYPLIIFHDHFVSDFSDFPRNGAGSQFEAGLLRSFPPSRIQPHHAARGIQKLTTIRMR